MDESQYKFRNFRNQYFAAYSANLLSFSHGCNLGWATNAILMLKSDKSPLASGPITLDQESWIGSMTSIGAIFGTFTSGYAAGRIGCKHTMAFLAIPSICYWLTIYFANSVHYIIFARFIAGYTGGGVASITVLYVAEIADTKIRGKLGSITQLSRSAGMLFAFIVNAFVDYDVQPYIFIIIPIVYLIKFIVLPNTPQHLLRKNKFEAAERSLIFYKGVRGNLIDEWIAITEELERLKKLSIQRMANRKLHWSDIYTCKAMKALTIGFVLSLLNQFTGVFIFLIYVGTILSKTGSILDANIAAILLGVCQVAGPLVSTYIADKMARKTLMIISLIGSVIGQLTLAIFSYLQDRNYNLTTFQWVPVTSLSFVVFIGSLGIVSMSPLCTLEILPRKIRTLGMTFTTISLNVFSFLISKLFPIWCEIIGLYGCLVIMAAISTIGIVFVIFVMEETKGRDLDSMSVGRRAKPKERYLDTSTISVGQRPKPKSKAAPASALNNV